MREKDPPVVFTGSVSDLALDVREREGGDVMLACVARSMQKGMKEARAAAAVSPRLHGCRTVGLFGRNDNSRTVAALLTPARKACRSAGNSLCGSR